MYVMNCSRIFRQISPLYLLYNINSIYFNRHFTQKRAFCDFEICAKPTMTEKGSLYVVYRSHSNGNHSGNRGISAYILVGTSRHNRKALQLGRNAECRCIFRYASAPRNTYRGIYSIPQNDMGTYSLPFQNNRSDFHRKIPFQRYHPDAENDRLSYHFAPAALRNFPI